MLRMEIQRVWIQVSQAKIISLLHSHKHAHQRSISFILILTDKQHADDWAWQGQTKLVMSFAIIMYAM